MIFTIALTRYIVYYQSPKMNHLWIPSDTFVTWVDPGILIRGSLRYSDYAQGQSTSILINIMSSELPHDARSTDHRLGLIKCPMIPP